MKPSETLPAVIHLIERRRPGMLWGAPGIGKSDILRQAAASLDIELRDVRLSTMDVVDVRGFPVPDLENQVMKWLVANFLPPMKIGNKANKSKGVLFLDELTSAVPAVQATMYQLMLDFRIGEYILPENWSIMAAGNRKTDRSVVHDMPAALSNRLIHIDVEVDADDWDNWARANNISSVTRGFMRFRPALLHKFDANAHAWPSGRSWAFVDRDIRGHNLPHALETQLVAGAVGAGAGAEYMAYATLTSKLPSVKEILAAPDTIPVPDDPSVLYAVATMLDTHLTTANMDKGIKFVERLPKEFQVLTMRGALTANPDLTTSPKFTTWLSKNSSLLIG